MSQSNEPIRITDQSWDVDTQPLVSISCRTYNQEKFIRAAIEGILMQKTTFPVELIIHDDASTDSTTDIIRDYESKYPHIIKPIYQEENQYSKGIKIGVKYIHPQIKGKYYAICEGDDYWIDPLKLQKQVDILEGNDEVGIVHTGFIKYDMINNVKTEQRVKVIGEPLDYYLNSWRLKTATVMFRTKFLDLVANVSQNPIISKSPYGDRVVYTTIAANSQIYYLDEITAVYRIYPGPSASRQKNPKKKYEIKYLMTKVDYQLMKELNINNYNYRLKILYRRVFYKLVYEALGYQVFMRLFKYLYHTVGLGVYKKSEYY